MKAILVIDIPDDSLWKQANDIFDRMSGYKCSLKPMPKELVYEGYDSPNKQIAEAILQSEWGKKAKKNDAICIRSFSIGYNACLEELEK